ncbi:MAG: hypothetical protein HQL99_07380 [Magnetococcales bacterium]|nr:hypothetical protein [Magnetococcales bacterium]
MPPAIPLTMIQKGFFKLNLLLLPVSLSLMVWIGIMAGSGPTSPGWGPVMLTVFGFLYAGPAALVLFHVVGAKLFDGITRFVPFSKPAISWYGILFAALLVVVLGNLFVDDGYQFRQGHYDLSMLALCLDMGGMVAVVASGGYSASLKTTHPPRSDGP